MELMIVLVVVLVISAAIFQTINLTTQRSSAEQTKVDMFQEAREFMDQMSRDLRQAGYPSPRNMDSSVLTQATQINDLHAAAGLVKVDAGELWFEGDVDGSGTISVVRYHLETTGTNCPCLQRSQIAKKNGDPVSGQDPEQYQVEVQGVQNTNIFTGFSNGVVAAPVAGLAVTIASNSGQTIAAIDTIQAMLTLQGATVDAQTRQRPVTTLISTVRLNNCSQAAIGEEVSCQ
jgi:type II secretory pathway component PulJ